MENRFRLEMKIDFQKNLESILETTKGSNFAAESNRFSKFSPNVQILGFSLKKIQKYMGISIKFLNFSKSLKVAKLHYNASETAKTLKTWKKLVFFEKIFVIFWGRIFFFQKNRHRYQTCTKMRLKIWTFPKRSNLVFLK